MTESILIIVAPPMEKGVQIPPIGGLKVMISTGFVLFIPDSHYKEKQRQNLLQSEEITTLDQRSSCLGLNRG